MAAILVFFFDLLSSQIGSHRDFISHILMYLLFTYIHTRNNATVIFFMKLISIFLKIIDSILGYSMCFDKWETKTKLLANYIPKYQMSSGPYGSIFLIYMKAS